MKNFEVNEEYYRVVGEMGAGRKIVSRDLG